MTLGEMESMFNTEGAIHAKLTVVSDAGLSARHVV